MRNKLSFLTKGAGAVLVVLAGTMTISSAARAEVPTCLSLQRGVAGDVHDTDVSPAFGSWAAGSYPGLWTGMSTANHWTLIDVDLSPVPAGAQVVAANLVVHQGWSDKPGLVRAHRVTAEWDEQTTSWSNFGGAASWDPATIATFDPLGQGLRFMDVTALVQGWHSGAVPAHGILLEEDPVPQHAHGYSSSESSSPGHRPRLDVCYVVPEASSGTALYFIHPDHLGTPRLIQDEGGDTVWRWDQGEPFGDSPPDEDPGGTGTVFEFPLRFSGQTFDVESGLSQNHFRDYDPALGRYVESDPIGLEGGMNTYLYANGSPDMLVDPQGTMVIPLWVPTLWVIWVSGRILMRPNGNFWGVFEDQDQRCSWGGSITNSNPRILACCLAHDACYTQAKCTQSSWIGNLVPGYWRACQQCNAVFSMCVLGVEPPSATCSSTP